MIPGGDLLHEDWRPIDGFPCYQVSNQGRVRSIGTRLNGGAAKILTTCVNPQRGYLVVQIRRDGKSYTKRVHRLVTEAFIGLRPAGMITRHLNGMKADNRLVNLRYGTAQENADDAKRLGEFPLKTHCKHGHEYSPENTTLWKVNGKPTRICLACRRAINEARRGPQVWRASDTEALAAVRRYRVGVPATLIAREIGVSDSLVRAWSNGLARPHLAAALREEATA